LTAVAAEYTVKTKNRVSYLQTRSGTCVAIRRSSSLKASIGSTNLSYRTYGTCRRSGSGA